MNEPFVLADLIPVLAPIFVIQLILMIIALVLCAKAERTRGPKWVWVIVIVLINIFGPIAFFIGGRRSE
ncbi:PLD nuclease N-terminal domain-containing protein [Paenibacillus sinopodophylli]|uniref:PLD nuclease N-terminal domain-containing protein n=1 Tax=Paenibacillus sinopodophylli TaxID=1837342 RepID=UPI00110C9AE1|nr:PLD nuclease N-terminal domain-containing protein [Paenibacillus sinopodophylli]